MNGGGIVTLAENDRLSAQCAPLLDLLHDVMGAESVFLLSVTSRRCVAQSPAATPLPAIPLEELAARFDSPVVGTFPTAAAETRIFGPVLCATMPINQPATVLLCAVWRAQDADAVAKHRSTLAQGAAQLAIVSGLAAAVVEARGLVADADRDAARRQRFFAVMLHDLRNPLAALTAGLRLLERKPDRAADIVPQMAPVIATMDGLISHAFDLANMRHGDDPDAAPQPPAMIEDALSRTLRDQAGTATRAPCDTHFALDRPVICNLDRLTRLLSSFLALGHAFGTPDQDVRVAASTSARAFVLSVSVAGARLPAEIGTNLFNSPESSRRGSGNVELNSYIAAEIARVAGGDVRADKTDAGLSFVFTLPLH